MKDQIIKYIDLLIAKRIIFLNKIKKFFLIIYYCKLNFIFKYKIITNNGIRNTFNDKFFIFYSYYFNNFHAFYISWSKEE